MSAFVEFEREVVRLLLHSHMPSERIEDVLDSASVVSYEHTGVGYFLTVKHPAFPRSRVVCSEPAILGRARDIECGFVVFLERGELTLECHAWGDAPIPADVRERALVIQPAP